MTRAVSPLKKFLKSLPTSLKKLPDSTSLMRGTIMSVGSGWPGRGNWPAAS